MAAGNMYRNFVTFRLRVRSYKSNSTTIRYHNTRFNPSSIMLQHLFISFDQLVNELVLIDSRTMGINE